MHFCEDIVSKYGSTHSSRYKDGGEAGRRARRRKWKGEGVGGIAPIISCGGPPELKTVICSRIDLSTPPNYQPIISKWTRVHPTPCALKVERDKIACLCLFHSLHVCLTLPFFYSSLSLSLSFLFSQKYFCTYCCTQLPSHISHIRTHTHTWWLYVC